MKIKLLVDGGEMKPGPVVGQQLGPIGINIGEVISKVNQATSEFKGMKVPITLDIAPKTKKFEIEVSSPPTSELLKKELGIEKGSGEHKKLTVANSSIEDIIKISKIKCQNMLSKEFKSSVKSVVGSCVSMGVLVENKQGVEIEKDIDNGIFDKEINSQKTETSPEKRKTLKIFLENVIKEQEAIKKAEEEAKAAAEAAAEAAKPKEAKEGEVAAEGTAVSTEAKEEKTAVKEVSEPKSGKGVKTSDKHL